MRLAEGPAGPEARRQGSGEGMSSVLLCHTWGHLLWGRSTEVSRVTGLETGPWGCRCPGNGVEQFSL